MIGQGRKRDGKYQLKGIGLDEEEEDRAITKLLQLEDSKKDTKCLGLDSKAKKDTSKLIGKRSMRTREKEDLEGDQEQLGEFRVRASTLQSVCEAFEEVDPDVLVSVETGDTFDLHSVQIKKHVPSTK